MAPIVVAVVVLFGERPKLLCFETLWRGAVFYTQKCDSRFI